MVQNDTNHQPEYGRQEDANISDVNGNVQGVQDVVDGPGGDHQTRVNRATDNPAQRIPGTLIKPIEEVVVSMLHHVSRGSVVEPEPETLEALLEVLEGYRGYHGSNS